jgi:hypothetical protein
LVGLNLPSAAKNRSLFGNSWAIKPGCFAFDEPVDREVVADFDRLALVMARQFPGLEARPHDRPLTLSA